MNIATATPTAVLVIPVEFATEYGFVESIVLKQILYWMERSSHIINGIPWIYNTIAQWHEQIPFISERSIRRAIRNLETLGFIQSDRKDAHWWNQRKWYTVNQKALEPYISQKRPTGPDQGGPSDRINNKDFSIEKIKETNTGLTPPNSVKPPTHPVVKVELEVDRGNTGLQTLHTVDAPIKENQEIKAQEPPKPRPDKPKLKPKQTPTSEKETISAPPAAIPPEIEAQIIKLIAPAPLNQNLRKQVLQVQAEVIGDAIAAIQQQIAAGKANNPIALFMSALKNKWKPNPTPSPITPLIPDDFSEWFELARKANLVLASSMRDGILHICTRTQEWQPYEDFRAGFTLPWLKRTLGIPIPDRSP